MVKKEILETGCYTGHLSEINPELLDKLESLSELRNKDLYTRVTHSYGKKVPSESTFCTTFEEAELVKNHHLDLKKKGEPVWQVFYTYNNESQKSSQLLQKYIPTIRELFNEVIKYCYGEDIFSKVWEVNSSNINLTNFRKDCFIENHADGGGKRMVCNLLIYHNHDWKEEDGGELVLEEKYRQQPKFGNFAVLDFMTHNPFHLVTPIKTEDTDRFALLTGILYEENYFNSIV
jgi:Rps23 Pro-64 3,4-dihydroxylase Tpa1-like proline 4-hydroxylase